MSRRGRPITPGPAGRRGRLIDELRALRALAPHLWPRDSLELRARVALALTFLVAGRGINIAVPFLYKHAVDALTPARALITVPTALIVAYGLARVMALGCNDLRNAAFAKVTQRAVRRLALKAFRHVHTLALRFHLERRTGGLARAIERGTAGIAIACAILWRLYSWTFAAVTAVTIVLYVGLTFLVTDWRVRFRRDMNERNSEA